MGLCLGVVESFLGGSLSGKERETNLIWRQAMGILLESFVIGEMCSLEISNNRT